MEPIEDHSDLTVWQRAMQLVAASGEVGRAMRGPGSARLRTQLLDAASSVPANIAEGHALTYTKEYLLYVSYARSSLKEAETHLWSAVAMRLVHRSTIEPALALADEVSRMLSNLKKSLIRRL